MIERVVLDDQDPRRNRALRYLFAKTVLRTTREDVTKKEGDFRAAIELKDWELWNETSDSLNAVKKQHHSAYKNYRQARRAGKVLK